MNRIEMWKFPINPVLKSNTLEGVDLPISRSCYGAITCPCNMARFTHNAATNLYTLSYKHQQLKYMHQSFFSPPIQTISDTINNNQLHRIPCLNSRKIVCTYRAPSPVTPKGHMKKQWANVRTTQPKTKTKEHIQRIGQVKSDNSIASPLNVPA